MRILIVEDDLRLAGLIKRGLEAEGFDTELAHDGHTGLRQARQGNHDAIMLDVMLPGLSGHAVCRQRAAMREALHDAERLERLAADLLLLARTDAEEPTRHAPVELSALVAKQSARRAMVRTRLVPAVVHGNAGHLERLVTNLLDNAEQHARTQITVSLTADQDQDQVVLRVADDGPGIPENDRERIFERFTRLDNARNRETGGAGLGLAIAKAIAISHNGTLRVTDGRPGACFILQLPQGEMRWMTCAPGPS
ncbi:hypothetical protein C1I98_17455 [Spongiactinospora gelatinilytica]|uniref:histidine kinase n=1 Tax=Spongiactinospora gelatinilytica TaxID=2666298 RepID=A0A2W2GNG6_9ACTN|nr:ATP-binding protein [Spongiactinospora gelatinilytica]PZG44219.1 hypothetical protein C1I98_17455 [Spongiactinospora gelatinilytica]